MEQDQWVAKIGDIAPAARCAQSGHVPNFRALFCGKYIQSDI
jgi:hypothetical protein